MMNRRLYNRAIARTDMAKKRLYEVAELFEDVDNSIIADCDAIIDRITELEKELLKMKGEL